MPGAKILFLDFDDVLNTPKTLERGELFDQVNIQNLNAILDRTDAKIVVTSTWRLATTPEELEQILVGAGVHAKDRVAGVTPWLPDAPRGAEIMAWFQEAKTPVEAFAILDNRTDMGTFSAFLVQTDPHSGLIPEQVDQVMGLLGSPL
jgi:hypothetical protein